MRGRHCAVVCALVAAAVSSTAGPASAQIFPGDCFVSDGGRILTATGSPATFGGSASSTSGAQLGHQVYIDDGPLTGFRFRSIAMTAMLCNLDAHRAEMYGSGEVTTQLGLSQPVEYRIAVLGVRSTSQVPDTYRITLSNGYDSGEQPVIDGNIAVRGT
ncbi:MAG TPA: hypothetical protein VF517_13650 [Thermoleophilaceae bacterium]|jgi:hypothetical protein